jgi:transposase
MSLRQLNHLDLLRRVERSELTERKAADLLRVTDRTVRRQLARLDEEGPGFLRHGLKGQPSNNRMPDKEAEKIEELLREKYSDFGPTFAAEKLAELHGIDRDPKTVRRILIRLGLFIPRRSRTQAVHRFWRIRRSIIGELVQFDGSYHDWFEGRGGISEACLLLAIDDATGGILDAQFAPHEGVLPVMGFWLSYAAIHGIPRAVYLDRFSTYSMNMKIAAENPDTLTQFERAATDVGMKIIHAHSPQAKGRVENAFGTLQDRLIKEMRLKNIRGIEEANVFLRRIFIPAYNRKFGRAPAKPGDLHRKPTERELGDVLPYVFCRKETRVVRNDFTLPYKTAWFQLLPTPRLAVRPKERVDVHEMPDESIQLFVRGKRANFLPLPTRSASGSESIGTLTV